VTNVRSIVKEGKVIVQGTLHKQIFYVGTDNIVHHVQEDVPFSDVWEFDPVTGRLVQKVILRLREKVTETQEIQVALDPYRPLIKADVVIGRGVAQKFIEETKTLPAVKIVDIVPQLRDMTKE